MSGQTDPNTYALKLRIPLKAGALLNTMANSIGISKSALVASTILKIVEDRDLDEDEQKWVDEHYARNLGQRECADLLTASGAYRQASRRAAKRGGTK